MIKETGACVIGLPPVQAIAQSVELRQALWSYLLQVE